MTSGAGRARATGSFKTLDNLTAEQRELIKQGINLSRRCIRRIIKRLKLVSIYQKTTFKPHSKEKNQAPIPNLLTRRLKQEKPLEAIVTDLTYVRIGHRWAYVCLIIDLFNRKMIGLSLG